MFCVIRNDRARSDGIQGAQAGRCKSEWLFDQAYPTVRKRILVVYPCQTKSVFFKIRLSGLSRDQVAGVARDDSDETVDGPMNVDEELRMREKSKK